MFVNESSRGSFETYAGLLEDFADDVDRLQRYFRAAQNYEEVSYYGILRLIFGFCPHELLTPLFSEGKMDNTRSQIMLLITEETIKYPELDFEMNTKFLVSSLAKYHGASIAHKISLVILYKTIVTFIAYFDGEYSKSFEGFRWCLKFLYYIKNSGIATQSIQDLLDDCERMVSLLCARSLILNIGNTLDSSSKYSYSYRKFNEAKVLQGLLFTVMELTDPSMMSSNNQLETFVLSRFFDIVGEIEENIAIFSGTLIEYVYDDQAFDFALRLQRCGLNEMIRKYILAVTIAIEGDPCMTHYLNKILEGIILFGGVHLDILKFFHALRSFYDNDMSKTSPPFKEHSLTEECVMMVDSIIADCEVIEAYCDPRTIQLPQVLLRTFHGSILMVDEFFEESSREHTHELSLILSSLKVRAKRKLLGDLHTQARCETSLRGLELEWINLWEESYLDNHGDFPSHIAKLALEIKQWPSK